MAQTREHLQILQPTGTQLTVALTKADRVDEARGIGEVREEVLAATNYGFADTVFYLSPPPMKRRIAELRSFRQRLHVLHAAQHRFRLAIDRAFTVKAGGTGRPERR